MPMKTSTIIICCVSIACISLGAAIGLALHYTLPRDELPDPGPRIDAVTNCIPQGDETRDICEGRGCTWREPTDGAPWCTFPAGYGYMMTGTPEVTSLGYRVYLQMAPKGQSLYSEDLDTIVLDVEMHTDSRIRLKFRDPDETRYQVPPEAVSIEAPDVAADNDTRLYDVIFQEKPQFGVKVIRRSSGVAVFNATLPGLTFSQQYLQLTLRLPTSHMYGLGEHVHGRYKHDMAWKNWTIFTRDINPVDPWNLYGAQPLYMNLEAEHNANGVLLLNSNAMEIALQPDPFPAITYHVTGGILDFYVFLGPSPEAVVQQYTAATGRPFMPPYWALGFQLSRWGYNNLTEVQKVVDRNREAGIPQDVQYGDIDYMHNKLDFTYDPVAYDGLPQFVEELHTRGQKYIIILDHAIGSNQTVLNMTVSGDYPPYTEGIQQDVFISDPRYPGQYLKGQLWPGECVFPDFTRNSTQSWWTDQCANFYNNDIKYDALWINKTHNLDNDNG